jgi:hypothetical protein
VIHYNPVRPVPHTNGDFVAFLAAKFLLKEICDNNSFFVHLIDK